MDPTTSGRYRVMQSPREPAELLLIDVESHDPTYVRTDTYEGELADLVDSLKPGHLISATLAWRDDGMPRFADLDIENRTLFEFVDDATNVFEAARETWAEARSEGAGVNSRVTYGTDGDPNGVCYVFAEQPGARDVWDEFRSGVLPLEPLLRRAAEEDDGEREVFVMRPREGSFVIVYLTLRKGSMLADTVRDTYGCPRA